MGDRAKTYSASSMERGKESGGEGHLGKPLNSSLKFSNWILASIFLLILAVGIVYAFTETFGKFQSYDDEGRLMISVQGILEGNALYDRVATHYGPVYYFYEWTLHKLAAIPLTNDTTAALCVAHWILGAAIFGLAGWRMTRSAPLAAFVFMQAVVHLEPLANEPGHPQEVVVLLLSVACLAAAGGLERRQALPLLAAIGTALLFTKTNVGGFFGMALALSMLCCTSGGRVVRFGVWSLILMSGTLPLLLMRPHYDEAWARYYSLQSALSILAVGFVANVYVTRRAIHLRDWGGAATASAVVSGAILLILLATGSTQTAIWESLVSGASEIGRIFYTPLGISQWFWLTWCALVVAVLFAGLRIKRCEEFMLLPRSLIKAFYGAMGSWFLVFDPVAQLGALLPWAWLVMVGTGKKEHDLFPRVFLSFLAVWQGLQAYPVAGTQVSIGTSLGVLVFSLCLWDALKVVAATSLLRRPVEKAVSVGGGRLVQLGALLALLEIFSMKWCEPIRHWRAYEANEPIGLSGCQYRRIDPGAAAQYRKLAEVLERSSDTFIILPGLNSMYFWTTTKPPTYFNVNGEGIMPTQPQQVEVVKALEHAGRSLVILRTGTGLHGTQGQQKEGPLENYVRERCQKIDGFAQFEILAPKSRESQH